MDRSDARVRLLNAQCTQSRRSHTLRFFSLASLVPLAMATHERFGRRGLPLQSPLRLPKEAKRLHRVRSMKAADAPRARVTFGYRLDHGIKSAPAKRLYQN